MKLSKYLTAGFAAAGLLAFTQPLQAQPDLDNMFLEEDTDLFDPGLPIGAQFPAIRAIHEGQEIDNIEQFFGDKGTVFFAVRSVDW